MGIISLTILILMPLWVLLFFCCKSSYRKFSHRGETFEKDQENMKLRMRFGAMLENFNTKKGRKVLLMPLFFMIRRLIIAATVIFMVDHNLFKSFMMIHHTLVALCLIWSIQAYNSLRDNLIDFFNELCVLLLSYHLILFNDWTGSDEVRYNIGWSMAGITVLNIVVNMLIVIGVALVGLYGEFKKYI